MHNPLNDKDIDGNTLNLNPVESSKEKYYNQFGLRHKSYRFKDFEDYLMTVFAEGDGACVRDDYFPEAYWYWAEELEYKDYIRFGNIYGRICKEQQI